MNIEFEYNSYTMKFKPLTVGQYLVFNRLALDQSVEDAANNMAKVIDILMQSALDGQTKSILTNLPITDLDKFLLAYVKAYENLQKKLVRR